MALSEREQKVLEQLEELMSNEDPNFASSMSSTGNTAPVFSARQLALGILCVLIGLGIVIGAVASHLIWLGVLGFLFAAFGVYFASTSKRPPWIPSWEAKPVVPLAPARASRRNVRPS